MKCYLFCIEDQDSSPDICLDDRPYPAFVPVKVFMDLEDAREEMRRWFVGYRELMGLESDCFKWINLPGSWEVIDEVHPHGCKIVEMDLVECVEARR